jgi:pyrimidine operon attenuation protein/uracil phosphoribosyltransferase
VTGDPAAARPVLQGPEVARAVDRMAHELLERTRGGEGVVLLGIPTRGTPLARRLAARVHAFEGVSLPTGSLDITLYRDDLRLKSARALEPTDVPPEGVDDRLVVLVDDVLFSGRTVRAPWTRWPTSAAPARCSSPSWWTAATASCPSGPTTSARTSPPRCARPCTCTWPSTTGRTRCSSARPAERQPGRRRAGRRVKRHLLSAADLTLEDATLVLDTATELAQLTRGRR